MSYSPIFLMSLFWGLFGVSWEAVDARIDEEFPGVESVSTEAFHAGQTLAEKSPRLIDVREAEEFAVSHLPNALHIVSGAEIASRFPDKSTPIVVYCSVGYRSARVAFELEQLGYSEVYNLRHSIFEWANNDYPLVNASGHTDRVHPFNRVWGSLLRSGRGAYRP